MRYNDYRFHLAVTLRMGTVTAYDFGEPSRCRQTAVLDPAAIGKVIWEAAEPKLPFVRLPRPEGANRKLPPGELLARAVGASSIGNMERTSAQVTVMSDGYETRFLGTSPTADYFDPGSEIILDPVLSTRSLFHCSGNPPDPEHSLLIAPWKDPEMLGQAVLNIFAMAGPPLNKGMISVFDPPVPRRRIALHRIAENGQVEDLPARKPRNLNPVDTEGMTPLAVAAQAGHQSMTAHLLAWGADSDVQDHQGRTPLHHAAENGHDQVITTLLEAGANSALVDWNGSLPLHLAAARGWATAAARLLDGGALPNPQDQIYFSTPLHLAARGNHRTLLPLLTSNGVNLNAPNEVGRTPLHVAAAYGHSKLARELITAGADTDCRDNQGETPLHRAAFYQHLKCMEALVQSGANPGAADNQGNTPVHVAASMNRVQATRLLLEAGAELEATNGEGMTPLDMAVVNVHDAHRAGREHNSEVVEALLEQGARLDPLRLPVGERHALWPHLTPADLLLPTGDIDYSRLPGLTDSMKSKLPRKDEDGNSPLNDYMTFSSLLHDAVSKEMPRLIENLVAAEALPSTAIRLIPTPLHLAAWNGKREMVDLLFRLGADLETPFHNAADGRHEGWIIQWRRENPGRNCQDFVQEFGGKWLRVAYSMRTALDYAVENGQVEMVRHLLDLGASPMPYVNERPPFRGPLHYPPGEHESYRWAWSSSPEAQSMLDMFREFMDIPYPPRFSDGE